jgi:hypothetical protein
MRSVDLIDFQEGRSEVPNCQVGKEEGMNSSRSSYQQGDRQMEEDQRSVLIIGGIQICLPSSPVEGRPCVAGAAEERQPTMTIIEEEKEKILKFSPTEEEEHSWEWLKSFIQEVEQEMTTAEEEEDTMDFSYLCEELESLEKRVKVQSQQIQQAKLETGGGAYQPKEQLEEARVEPAQEELIEFNLSEEEAEKQLSEETAKLETAGKWQANAKREK